MDRNRRRLDNEERRLRRNLDGAKVYRFAMWASIALSTIQNVMGGKHVLYEIWTTIALIVSLLGLGVAHWAVMFWNREIDMIEAERKWENA